MNDFFKRLASMLFVLAGITGCQSPGLRPDAVELPHRLNSPESEQRDAPPSGTKPQADNLLPVPPPSDTKTQADGPTFGRCPLSVPPENHNRSCISQTPCGRVGLRDFHSLSPQEIFRQDRADFFPTLARDARGLLNWRDMALLGGALGGALVVREELDDDVRDWVLEHPERWDKASETLGILGEVQYQVPVILGVYGYSVYSSNEELHELSKALISAYTITGLSTVVVKGIADTDRPSPEWNDGRFGFPSFHVASSFSIASVVEEYEGLPTALPVYAVAGLIGWSRIDERDHDLSDVLFGAALGYVIGKSVSKQHIERESNWHMVPYSHPTEPAAGLGAEVQF